MALEFTKLTEVDNVEEPVDGATVIIENAGAVKRTPVRNIGKVKTINGVEPDEDGNVEIEVGKVKTINGVEPDEDGNVEIEAGTSIQPIIITKYETGEYSINCSFADFKALVLAGATVVINDLYKSRIQYAYDYYLFDEEVRIISESHDIYLRIDGTVDCPPV